MLARMAAYRLFRSPTGETVRVKMGFSWRAFAWESLWALARRIWLLLLLLGVVGYVGIVIDPEFFHKSRNVPLLLLLFGLYVCYMAVCGACASRWLIRSLRRRGFTPAVEDRTRHGRAEPVSPRRSKINRTDPA